MLTETHKQRRREDIWLYILGHPGTHRQAIVFGCLIPAAFVKKTLRDWAKKGYIVAQARGYHATRYFVKPEYQDKAIKGK